MYGYLRFREFVFFRVPKCPIKNCDQRFCENILWTIRTFEKLFTKILILVENLQPSKKWPKLKRGGYGTRICVCQRGETKSNLRECGIFLLLGRCACSPKFF
jgi:hypothetical protein